MRVFYVAPYKPNKPTQQIDVVSQDTMAQRQTFSLCFVCAKLKAGVPVNSVQLAL